jgi:antibiotic biosynthesis monooxygenase (ABM) superfamily enzyme
MKNNPIMNLVASECRPEEEKRFNKWYNEVHIPLLFKYQGMKKVTRYKRLSEQKEHPTYLALYEFESKEALDKFSGSPERGVAFKEMQESWKNGGFEITWAVPYESLKTWER